MAKTRVAALWSSGVRDQAGLVVLAHPVNKDLRMIVSLDESTLLLDEDGDLLHLNSAPSPYSQRVDVPFKVKQIASNGSAVLLLTEEGSMYAWGEDRHRTGVFGIPRLFSADTPVLVECSSVIVQVAIGQAHAAALDNVGILYTWGSTGHQVAESVPTRVEKSNIFTGKQVVCGPTFTVTCSGGGYVQIYGHVGRHLEGNKTERSLDTPHPVPELEQYFVTSVSAGADFVVVLTDLGQAYVFDECAELVRLPTACNVAVRHVAAYDQMIIGMTTDEHLYEWTQPALTSIQFQFLARLVQEAQVPCSLMTWSGKVFSVNSYYATGLIPISGLKHGAGIMFKTADIGINTPNLGRFLTEINPYRRIKFTKKLIETVQSSAEESLDATDLEMLLDQDDDRSFAKAVQFRLEQEQRESLTRSLVPIVNSRLRKSLSRVKEYAEALKLYKATVDRGRLPNLFMRFASRFETQRLTRAFQAMKDHKTSVSYLRLQQACQRASRSIEDSIKVMVRVLRKTLADFMRERFVEIRSASLISKSLECGFVSVTCRIQRETWISIKQFGEDKDFIASDSPDQSAFSGKNSSNVHTKSGLCHYLEAGPYESLKSKVERKNQRSDTGGNPGSIAKFNFDEILVKKHPYVPKADKSAVKPPLGDFKRPMLFPEGDISQQQSNVPRKVPKLKLDTESYATISGSSSWMDTEDALFSERKTKNRRPSNYLIKSVAVTPRSRKHYSPKQQNISKTSSRPETPKESDHKHQSMHSRNLTPHCCLNQLSRGVSRSEESIIQQSRSFKAIDSRMITRHLMSSQDSDNYLRQAVGLEMLIEAMEKSYRGQLVGALVKLKYFRRLNIPTGSFLKNSRLLGFVKVLSQMNQERLEAAWLSLVS